ncbi:murein hydrolase activator EnvC family protein [Streptomyces pristinaespiralis]|uniref:murein hydrolase activator EnvC family protein n=1 Tax=Streptomyces pristinaespiralis TaxID=38300 RepID=UPI00383407AA
MNCASSASAICRVFAVPVLVALTLTGGPAAGGTPGPAGDRPAAMARAVPATASELRAGSGPPRQERNPLVVGVDAAGTDGLTSVARGASPRSTPAAPVVRGDGVTAGLGHRRAARDPAAGPDAQAPRSWPVGAPRPLVVRGWEPPSSPYGPGHRGVDLAATAGTPVRAAASGTVSFAGSVAGRGVLTITLTGTGDPPLRTTYEPVRPLVEEGAAVTAGQVVASVEPGSSHCRGCLHWGLRRGTEYLDPLTLLPPWLLRRGPSRLLPVFGVPGPRTTATPLSPAATAGPGDLLHAALLLATGTAAHHTLRNRSRRAGPGGVDAGPAGRRAPDSVGPAPRRRRDPDRRSRGRPGTPSGRPDTETRRSADGPDAPAGAQPRTPRSTIATAASAMASGSSAAPSSMRRTAASTTP